MPTFKNPNYKAPKGKTETRLESLKPLIDHFIKKLPADVENVDFNDIRDFIDTVGFSDEFGKLTSKDLTDVVIRKIADDRGIARG